MKKVSDSVLGLGPRNSLSRAHSKITLDPNCSEEAKIVQEIENLMVPSPEIPLKRVAFVEAKIDRK